jgi:hypothetical protein
MKRHAICCSLSVVVLVTGCFSGSGGPTVPPVPQGASATTETAKPVAPAKGKGTVPGTAGPTAKLND